MRVRWRTERERELFFSLADEEKAFPYVVKVGFRPLLILQLLSVLE